MDIRDRCVRRVCINVLSFFNFLFVCNVLVDIRSVDKNFFIDHVAIGDVAIDHALKMTTLQLTTVQLTTLRLPAPCN